MFEFRGGCCVLHVWKKIAKPDRCGFRFFAQRKSVSKKRKKANGWLLA